MLLVGVVHLFGQGQTDVPSLLSVEFLFGCEELVQPSREQVLYRYCAFLFLYNPLANLLDLIPSDTLPASSGSFLPWQLHFLEVVQVIPPQQLSNPLLFTVYFFPIPYLL